MKMANISPFIIVSFLFWGLAVGTRRQLFTEKNGDGVSALASSSRDGICASMVLAQGYPCEEHTVTTEDGNILSMQRIPAGKFGETSVNKIPVLLQHGLLMDGITWMLLPPDQALAFLLADNGYEVWIGNTRGTQYSLSHTSLTPDDPENTCSQWLRDELVAYDLPAMYEYVYDQAGQKIHYIGHSLGTLIALGAFAKDQLLKMLRSAVLLSPTAHVGQMTSPLARAAAENYVAEALYKAGYREFNPRLESIVKFLNASCAKSGVDCTNLLTSFTGQNCCLKPSIVQVFLAHEPQASATKNMIHISQMIRDGKVAMFDYIDEYENRKHYRQDTPPEYKIASIPHDFPLFLSYGGADALSDVQDVKLLLNSLRDHDGDKVVVQCMEDYAHADFVMGETAKQDVYDPLLAFLRLQ